VKGTRAIAAGLAVGAAAGGAAIALAGTEQTALVRRPAGLSPPARSALSIPRPTALGAEPHLTRWAVLRRATAARASPSRSAPVVAPLSGRTPEDTPHPLPILGRATDAAGTLWLRVALPVLPNGTRGWVPRSAVGGYQLERHRLVVDLRLHRATLLLRGRRIFTAPVGVGMPGTPTPSGRFIVRNRLERYASRQYGPVAFGTSARSPTLTDWPAGGFVGIHGTDRPDLLPGDVSHGCIRLRNSDILRLRKLMPVGTPLVIR
jgi:hypothetical protein